jgi:trehalose 6-phosphate synthase
MLKRISLSKEEIEGYYLVYDDSSLWPLCHTAFKRPEFVQQHWETY